MNEFWGYFLPKAREILGKCMANAKDLIPVLCRGALVGVQVQAPRTGFAPRGEVAVTLKFFFLGGEKSLISDSGEVQQ